MTKKIELSDIEFEVIRNFLDYSISDWKEYNRVCGYDNSLELVTESLPAEYDLSMVEVDEIVSKLLANQFEM